MRFLPKKSFALITIIYFASLTVCMSQGVKKEELVAAYVYSFAKNIDWPKDDGPFRIQLICNNDELAKEFTYLASNKDLNGRPIEVISSNSAIVSQQSNLVFVTSDLNSTVRSVFLQMRDLNTLLVTDEFPDNRFTMINFKRSSNNTITFDINRANILNQGLGVQPEMILLGGTEIDMAQLYREAQDSIQTLQSEVSNLQTQSDSLNQNIQAIQVDITKQQSLIRYQSLIIDSKQGTIVDQNDALDSLQAGIMASEERLLALTNLMMEREENFKELQANIEEQEKKLTQGQSVLDEQFRLIDEQETLIAERETRLEQMVSVVSTQKRTVIMLIMFSVVVLGFLMVAYRAYKQRRDHARELKDRHDELSRLLNELKQTQTQLVQSEKMASLGVLTAGIAHEINNAINFVGSGIHILEQKIKSITPVINKLRKLKKDENLEENVNKLIELKEKMGYNDVQLLIREVVKNIKIGADRTTDIVKGLRTFSMSDTESVIPIDVVSEMDVALLLLNNLIKDKIEVKKVISDVPQIEGYKGQLGQVFMNILSNAADALENTENPRITIGIAKLQKKIKVTISDNGPGIDPQEIDKIFDPFFTTKKIGAGTGLGLSIAYGIIDKHKGEINVTSKDGKGAQFTILLPLKIAK